MRVSSARRPTKLVDDDGRRAPASGTAGRGTAARPAFTATRVDGGDGGGMGSVRGASNVGMGTPAGRVISTAPSKESASENGSDGALRTMVAASGRAAMRGGIATICCFASCGSVRRSSSSASARERSACFFSSRSRCRSARPDGAP